MGRRPPFVGVGCLGREDVAPRPGEPRVVRRLGMEELGNCHSSGDALSPLRRIRG